MAEAVDKPRANAPERLRELITQNYNHPSVVRNAFQNPKERRRPPFFSGV
jgi:hypothetical protein